MGRFCQLLKKKKEYMSVAAFNCRGKIRYPSKHISLQARAEKEKKHRAKYKVYPCDQCRGWHLTKVKTMKERDEAR